MHIPLYLLRKAGATKTILLDLFVDLLLNEIDNGVDLVIFEERQFSFRRQAEKGLHDHLRFRHHIHEFYVMIPILFPAQITDNLVQLPPPQVEPDPQMPRGSAVKL